jgi:hypothetical protein
MLDATPALSTHQSPFDRRHSLPPFLCLLVRVQLPKCQIGKSPLISKNRCRRSGGGSLQPQKGTPPCLPRTTSTSKKPSSGNSVVRQGSGCRREHKPFGTVVFLTKQQRCTPSSPEVLPWASDHEDLKRSIPKPPQVALTPSPTKVQRCDKYSLDVLGAVGFVSSTAKTSGGSHSPEVLCPLVLDAPSGSSW